MKRVAILLSVLLAFAPCAVYGQTASLSCSSSGQETGKQVSASHATTASDEPKQVSLKIEEGERITLRNRFGPIIVTGGGGDTVEASVQMIKQGKGNYSFKVAASRQGKGKIMIATAVTTTEQAMSEKAKKSEIAAKRAAADSEKAPPPSQPTPPAEPQPMQKRAPRAGVQGAARAAGAADARTPRPEKTETPAPESLRGVGDIKLEVRLPRNARIELIDSRRYAIVTSGNPTYLTNTRNDVTVTNMDTPVSIISSGEVRATKVAAIEVRTRAGSVQVKDIAGLVNISTVMGEIRVKDANGDVRAVSISGPITIECARGRTEAGTANAAITLTGIGGDLDAVTTGGAISFTGAIREGGRYRLKSMSGAVRMLIQREPPGFLTGLSSYKGQILVEFDLKTELSANTATGDLPATQGQPVRRMMGRYGEGDARITLDSFSGTVQLGRAPSEVWKSCR